jgi:hypothetical protein
MSAGGELHFRNLGNLEVGSTCNSLKTEYGIHWNTIIPEAM